MMILYAMPIYCLDFIAKWAQENWGECLYKYISTLIQADKMMEEKSFPMIKMAY